MALRDLARTGFGMRGTAQDARHALRTLRRAPWYALTVIGVIALGMSLATTVFAVVDGVLFKPLPYRDADRLVAIQPGFSDPSARGTPSASAAELDAWQAAMPEVAFTGMVVQDQTGLELPNEAGIGVGLIRPNLFDVLGVQPLMGGFTPDDFARGSSGLPALTPAVISFELWQGRFGGEMPILGRVLESSLMGRVQVVGVLPKDFVVPEAEGANVLVPPLGNFARPSQRDYRAIARLPPGMEPEAFEDRLETVMQRLMEGRPLAPGGRRFLGPFDRATVTPLGERMAQPTQAVFLALFAAAAVLVLIACANVSGLMAARCLDRSRDVVLRRAIGARDWQVARVLLAEHGVLLLAGTALGVALAAPLLRATLALLPADVHLLKVPAIDLRVAAFAALAMTLSLGLTSVLPLRRALRLGIRVGIADAVSTPRVRTAGSFAMTAVQVAGTVALVVGGGLFVGSLLRVQANALGFDTEDLVIAQIQVDPREVGQAADSGDPVRAVVDRFLEEVRSLPGVRAAGATSQNILSRSWDYSVSFRPIGYDREAGDPLPAQLEIVIPISAGFAEAAGLQLIDGRLPSDNELHRGDPVVLVSRTYAGGYFPGERAVGQFLAPRVFNRPPLQPHRIVGVVEDVRTAGWDLRQEACVFAPYATFGSGFRPSIFVRTRGHAGRVIADLLALAERPEHALRVLRAQPAQAMLADTIRPRRLQAWLFGTFGVAGLLLAGVGLLGLVGMSTARRTREIGIRMALGATRDRLVSGLVREQLVPVLAGLAAGMLVAAWGVRFLESYLYELTVYDARVWAVALAVVAATALTGALVPSLRASRVDPVRALRVE